MEVLTGVIIDAEVVNSTQVILDSKLPDTEVDVTKSITAEVSPQNYVLSSDGMYGAGFTGSAPTWLLNAIQQELTTGTGNIMSILDEIQTVLDSLTLGVNQNIAQIESTILSQASLVTSIQSQIDANEAAILDVSTTRVTPLQAQTIATQVQQSTFGTDVTAFIGSIASTYVAPGSAIAQSVETVVAELNGVNASITTIENVNISQGLSISQLAYDTGVSIIDLQNQIDGSVSTWFYATSPEYSTTDTTVALLSTSTDTGTELTTNAKVFHTTYSQMYKYIGTYVANYNLTTADFSNTSLWTPIYKMVLPEAAWLATDAGASTIRHSLSTDSGTELIPNALVYKVDTDQMYKFLPLIAENNVNLTLETWSNTLRWEAVTHTKVTTQRNNHIGDLYYDSVTGFAYRYIYSDINDNPNQGLVFSWIQIVDSDTITALANAATAQATADGKRTIFYTDTTPIPQIINGITIPIATGDLWVNKTTKITKAYSDLGLWVDITNTATENAIIDISVLEETNDGVVSTFYQTAIPTVGMSYGDWWVDTDAIPIIAYRYQDINGKNVGTLSWVNESTSILGRSMVESDTAKKNIEKVVNGTTVIDISNATVNGSTIATYVAAELDKEVVILSGTTNPTTGPTTPIGKLNDIYIQKSTATGVSGIVVDVVNTWKHNGTIWVEIGSNSNLTSLADMADGKRTIYAGTTAPTSPDVNDIWIPATGVVGYTAKELYMWNGSVWVLTTKYTDDTLATTANNNAIAAQGDADTAILALDAIADDNKLTASEKQSIKLVWDAIVSEVPKIDANADSMNVSRIPYDSTYTTLSTYITPILSDLGTTSTIVGTTLRSTFKTYYDAKIDLLNAIALKASTMATWSNIASRPTSLATLNSTDGTALSDAVTAISNISSDNVLSAVEKSNVRKEWNTIVAEKSTIEAQATTLSITTEKDTYIAAIISLGTYMNAGVAWIFSTTTIPTWINDASLGLNTTIVGSTFRSNFSTYYSAREALVLKISAQLKLLADTAQSTANVKSIILYQNTAPTLLTHPLLDTGDQWVDTTTKELKVWDGDSWEVTTNDIANKAYTAATSAPTMYNSILSVPPVPVSPYSLKSGDLWVVTDRWYTNATDVTSGTTRTTYGYLVKRYSTLTSTWSDLTNTEAKASSLKWEAKSSKYITAPDGSITGFEMSDGSSTTSAFTVTADTFKVVASGQTVASKNPLIVDAVTGDITFNGKVSFNNITDVEMSNINIANAIYSDFEYTSIPTKTDWSLALGYVVGAEPILNSTYKYTGTKSLEIVATGINAYVELQDSTQPANIGITPNGVWILSCYVYLTTTGSPKTTNNCRLYFRTMPSGVLYSVLATVPLNIWTRVSGVIDLSADNSTSGFIMLENNSYNGGGATSMMFDGVMLEKKLGNNIEPSTYVLPSMKGSDVATLVNSNTTTIDGGKITTGSVTAGHIDVNGLTASNFNITSLEGRNAFANSIGTSLLEYTPFMKDFFALANKGEAPTIKQLSASTSICSDHFQFATVYREGNDIVLWVYGTAPDGITIGWNCGGSQGNKHILTYTETEASNSKSISVNVSSFQWVWLQAGTYESFFNFTYDNFYAVPLFANRTTKQSPYIDGGAGAHAIPYQFNMLGIVASSIVSIIDYSSAHGGMATQIGKTFTISVSATGICNIMLPIGVYAINDDAIVYAQRYVTTYPAGWLTGTGSAVCRKSTDSIGTWSKTFTVSSTSLFVMTVGCTIMINTTDELGNPYSYPDTMVTQAGATALLTVVKVG